MTRAYVCMNISEYHLLGVRTHSLSEPLESIIYELATKEISTFYLVSVAEETGLSFALSETPKTGCVTSRPNFVFCVCWQIIGALLELHTRNQYFRKYNHAVDHLNRLHNITIQNVLVGLYN